MLFVPSKHVFPFEIAPVMLHVHLADGWDRQECSPENLVHKVKKCTFVAIDVAGHHHEVINDIGIAILPTFPDTLLDTPLDSVAKLETTYAARIQNFRIRGQPLPTGHAEPLAWGTEDMIEIEEVEDRVTQFLQQAKADADAIGNELVLLLFSAQCDLRTLVKFCPGVLTLFSWWTDLQATVSAMDEVAARRDPSLRRVLLGLDMGPVDVSRKNAPVHPSANDAARTLAVLAGIVRKYRAGESFCVKPPQEPRPRCRIGWHWHSRPQPSEMYPFVALLRLDHLSTTSVRSLRTVEYVPKEYRHPANLYEVFAAYQPTAVARNFKKPSRNMACVFVCLPTREALARFVSDYQGKQMQDGRLWVEDVSFAGAPETSMSLEEIRAHWQELRQMKKENCLPVEEVEDIGAADLIARMLSID